MVSWYPLFLAAGTTYYVAASGSDLNTGKSPAQAWQTIVRVNSQTYGPGDKILFNGGDTFVGTLSITPSTLVPSGGISNVPVTLGSYGTGQATILGDNPGVNGGSQGPISWVINIDSVSGVVVDNLNIIGTGTVGVRTIYDTTTSTDSSWTLSNVTNVSNLVTDTASNTTHATYKAGVFVKTGVTYKVTWVITAGTLRYVSLRGGQSTNGTVDGSLPWVTLDTTNGTITNNGVGSSTVTSLGGSQYQVTITWTSGIDLAFASPVASGSNISTAPIATASLGTAYVGSGQTFTINELKFEQTSGTYTSTGTQFGVLIQNSLGINSPADMTNITVKNCSFSGFYILGSPSFHDQAGGILINGFTFAGHCGGIDTINFLNNTFSGASTSDTMDVGISSQNVCGIGVGNQGNVTNNLIQGNLCYNIGGQGGSGNFGGSGIFTKATLSTVQYNLVHDCGGNSIQCGGPCGIWGTCDTLHIQFNEVYNQQPITFTTGCDWAAIDLDLTCNNNIVQYNYSHHCAGPSLLAFGGSNWGNNTFRYNISENDNYTANDGGGVIAMSWSDGPCYVYNNTVYQNINNSGTTPPCGVCFGFNSSAFNTSSLCMNNIFYMLGTDQFGRRRFVDPDNAANPTNVTLDYNCYYSGGLAADWRWTGGTLYSTFAAFKTASGKEAHGINVDPTLVTPGGGGNVMPNSSGSVTGPNPTGPNAYKLQAGSPCIGTGANLTSSPFNLTVGTRDYFGNTIPHGTGTGYNMGAYGGT